MDVENLQSIDDQTQILFFKENISHCYTVSQYMGPCRLNSSAKSKSDMIGIDPYRNQFHFQCWIIKK